MAEETTRLAKGKAGYGYKYTELAQINEWLEAKGESYYQFTEDCNGKDYIMTVKVNAKGEESKPIRGCQIIDGNTLNGGKANVAQQLGAAITYARRYSLLMAYGLATEDDDAESLTQQPQTQRQTTQRTTQRQTQRQTANQPQQPQQSQPYEVNNPTAKDVQALAKEVNDNLETKARLIAYWNKMSEHGQKAILDGYKIKAIEELTPGMCDHWSNCLKTKNITF